MGTKGGGLLRLCVVLGVQKLDTKGVPVVSDGIANAAESAGVRVLWDPPFPHFGLLNVSCLKSTGWTAQLPSFPAFVASRFVYAFPKIHPGTAAPQLRRKTQTDGQALGRRKKKKNSKQTPKIIRDKSPFGCANATQRVVKDTNETKTHSSQTDMNQHPASTPSSLLDLLVPRCRKAPHAQVGYTVKKQNLSRNEAL